MSIYLLDLTCMHVSHKNCTIFFYQTFSFQTVSFSMSKMTRPDLQKHIEDFTKDMKNRVSTWQNCSKDIITSKNNNCSCDLSQCGLYGGGLGTQVRGWTLQIDLRQGYLPPLKVGSIPSPPLILCHQFYWFKLYMSNHACNDYTT